MRRVIIPYWPGLKERANQLRKRATPTEIALWSRLKGKQVRGLDFHRQKPLLRYIVDFYCPDLMLAIEIDGGAHTKSADLDTARQATLEGKGVRFLRFTTRQIETDLEAVVATIQNWIDAHPERPGLH